MELVTSVVRTIKKFPIVMDPNITQHDHKPACIILVSFLRPSSHFKTHFKE
jgi:hypothetical protein